MSEKSMDLWKSVAQWGTIALCSGSLGFGASQMTVVKQVSKMEVEMAHLAESDAKLSEQTKAVQAECNERIRNITVLLQEMVKQNTELITLIKVQQLTKP